MKKKNIIIPLAAIFIVGIIGGSYGLYMFFKKHKDLAKEKPDFTLTSGILAAEFDADETAASKKYIDKIVEVTGLVESIEMGTDSTINVTLKESGASAGVICAFQGRGIEDVKVKKGDHATMRGDCSGFLFDVLLNNCVLISQKQ
jgi:hypothetical protein